MGNKVNFASSMALVASLLVSHIAFAEVYRWIDEDGAVHFGDKPHGNPSAEKIEIKKGTTSQNLDQQDRLKKQQHLLSVMGEERKIKQQRQATEKKNKGIVIENCNKAKKALADNLKYGLLFEVDKSGNKVYLSDQEREEEIKKYREAVKYWCKK